MGIGSRWGRLLMHGGAREAGRRLLHRAAKGGDPDAAVSLAEALENEGALQDAAEVLKECIRSGGAGVALYLADIECAIGGESNEAEYWYRIAIKEGISGARNNFGCYLSDIDRTFEAEEVLRGAAEGGDGLAAGNLGKLHFDLGDYESSYLWLKAACDSGNTATLPYLARVEIEKGEQEEAFSYVTDALKESVEGSELAHALYLWKFSTGQGDVSETEAAFKRSLDGAPEAHFHYANWLKSQGRLNEAMAQHELAINLGEIHSHLNLAIIVDDLGRHAEAEQHLRLGMAGRDGAAAASLARFLADQGKLEEIPYVIDEAARLGHPQSDISRLREMYRELREKDY
ncbi:MULTISPECIES: hypothetical protein [unclassified Streptomyces]|uniref:hypothetical protein n=1 Tax=unclassified Streptomyces TaxID=2593676 RepID=UPI0037F1EACB